MSGSGGQVVEKETIAELCDGAQDCLDRYEYDPAQKFIYRALEIDPDSARALELCANMLIEAGDIENAKHCLGRAITVLPDRGHSKYLSMAQLFLGREALNLYTKGIQVLLVVEAPSEEASSSSRSSRCLELSTAYCAVAELYMTDLCDEAEAETECEKAIQLGVEADPNNPEALQTKARFLVVKEKFEVPLLLILRSLYYTYMHSIKPFFPFSVAGGQIRSALELKPVAAQIPGRAGKSPGN